MKIRRLCFQFCGGVHAWTFVSIYRCGLQWSTFVTGCNVLLTKHGGWLRDPNGNSGYPAPRIRMWRFVRSRSSMYCTNLIRKFSRSPLRPRRRPGYQATLRDYHEIYPINRYYSRYCQPAKYCSNRELSSSCNKSPLLVAWQLKSRRRDWLMG